MNSVNAQITEIPLKGITTSPSDYDCQDGELSLSLGLQNKDGSYMPAPVPAEVMTIPAGYELMYIHHTTTNKDIYILRHKTAGYITYMVDGVIPTKTYTQAEKDALYMDTVLDKANKVTNTTNYIATIDSKIALIDSGQWADADLPEASAKMTEMNNKIAATGFPQLLRDYDALYGTSYYTSWNAMTNLQKYDAIRLQNYDSVIQRMGGEYTDDYYMTRIMGNITNKDRYVCYYLKMDGSGEAGDKCPFLVAKDGSTYYYVLDANGNKVTELDADEEEETAIDENEDYERIFRVVKNLTVYNNLNTMWDTITDCLDDYYEYYEALTYAGDGASALREQLVAEKATETAKLQSYQALYDAALAYYNSLITTASDVKLMTLGTSQDVQVVSMGNIVTMLTGSQPVKNILYKDNAYVDFQLPKLDNVRFLLSGEYNTFNQAGAVMYSKRTSTKLDYEHQLYSSQYTITESEKEARYFVINFPGEGLKAGNTYKLDISIPFKSHYPQGYVYVGSPTLSLSLPASSTDTNYSYTPCKNIVSKEDENASYENYKTYKVSFYFECKSNTNKVQIFAVVYYEKGSALGNSQWESGYAPLAKFETPEFKYILYQGTSTDTQYLVTPDEGVEMLNTAINDYIKTFGTDKNKFIYPFFLRYGLELYDGTIGYVSAPILMLPNTGVVPAVVIQGFEELANADDSKKKRAYISTMACNIVMSIQDKNTITELKANDNIVKSIVIAVSSPLSTYDQDYTNKPGKYIDIDEYNEEISWSYASMTTQSFSVQNSEPGKIGLLQLFKNFDGNDGNTHIVKLPAYSSTDYLKKVENIGSFYIIKKIPIDKLSEEDTTIILDDGMLASLEAQQQLDTSSIQTSLLGASSALVYNGRLNLANIKEYLQHTTYPALQACYSTSQVNYAADTYLSTKYRAVMDCVFNNQIYTISTEYADNNYTPYCWFYSHYNVKKATIYKVSCKALYGSVNNSDYKASKLVLSPKEHPFLTGSYCMANSFSGFDWETASADEASAEIALYKNPTKNDLPIVEYNNKLYLSNVSDPLTFSLGNVSYIGAGKIIGMATAARAISQGQFGQFPLYVFTDEGVYALEVNDTGTYSAAKPLTRDVCINASSITSLDTAVVFATERGIMLLQGGEAVCITDELYRNTNIQGTASSLISKLDEDDYASAISMLEGITEEISFTTFFRQCSIIYDYSNQRLLFYTASASIMLIYNLELKTWNMAPKNISYKVNHYPDAWAVNSSGKLLNLSSRTLPTAATTGILITRPLTFDGQSTFKTLCDIRLNGVLAKDDASIIIYVSNDLINWDIYTTGNAISAHYRGGTPWRYYKLAIITHMPPGHSLSSISVMYKQIPASALLSI